MSPQTEASSHHMESLVRRLNDCSVKVILAGVQSQPMRVFARAGWRNRHGRLRIFRSFDRGIALARLTRVPGIERRSS